METCLKFGNYWCTETPDPDTAHDLKVLKVLYMFWVSGDFVKLFVLVVFVQY